MQKRPLLNPSFFKIVFLLPLDQGSLHYLISKKSYTFVYLSYFPLLSRHLSTTNWLKNPCEKEKEILFWGTEGSLGEFDCGKNHNHNYSKQLLTGLGVCYSAIKL